ncbi:MAG: hypothetical protein HOM21_16920, partial [Halobacteriovoraceae bacterium]|nr:hypothetical protein [Halobacteriovoraceae bacterium]
KERLAYFDRPLDKSNIESIVVRINEFHTVGGDLNPKEQKTLDRLIDTLRLECLIIFEFTQKASKEYISGFLTKE